jgi:hypothetical protein
MIQCTPQQPAVLVYMKYLILVLPLFHQPSSQLEHFLRNRMTIPTTGGFLVMFATAVRKKALIFTMKLGMDIKGRGTPEISLIHLLISRMEHCSLPTMYNLGRCCPPFQEP